MGPLPEDRGSDCESLCRLSSVFRRLQYNTTGQSSIQFIAVAHAARERPKDASPALLLDIKESIDLLAQTLLR